jgi:hypothetical protein
MVIALVCLLVVLGLCSGACWAVCLICRRHRAGRFRERPVPLTDIDDNSIPPIIEGPAAQDVVLPAPFGPYAGQRFAAPQPAYLPYPAA